MTTQVANQVAARARRPTVSAGVPILASKITAPGVPDWVVPRPRITRLIAGGTRRCPLTVAIGPAGAGKTMALALWAAAGPGPVAWVGVDEYDNEPEVFWSYVIAAVRRCGVAVPGALPAAARGTGHLFLLRLAAALAAQDPPVTLVLDDLHLLADPTVLDGLDYVLRNAGAGLRLVASARMDPPLPLHRYRLAGQLTEIRASDLAFTVAEARLLLARHGITLTADALECLTRRTEGWAAGLRLAAISMGTHPDRDQFVTELITDNSALTGYLVAEVLNTQPPEARDILLSTSILEQVSAQAASELTGNEQAAAILPAVAHANGFVQPTRSGWYRYHPLFAEVLRLKLSREYPDRRAALHRRAAGWYERNGQLTDAVRHAAETGDWPLAAGIVIDHLAIGEIIEPRRSPSLAGEFGRMPPPAKCPATSRPNSVNRQRTPAPRGPPPASAPARAEVRLPAGPVRLNQARNVPGSSPPGPSGGEIFWRQAGRPRPVVHPCMKRSRRGTVCPGPALPAGGRRRRHVSDPAAGAEGVAGTAAPP